MIKCVVWDLDNTLLAGTYLESDPGCRPGADPVLLGVLRELAARGIVHAIASRNPPEAAAYAARLTGTQFAAAQCGWDAKPDAISRIIADLGFGADSVAFVDDDPLERAEVAAALPAVLVLSPEDAAGAGSWPQFSPAVVTPEGRRRSEMYAQRRLRQEQAQAFAGSRAEFLRRSGTRLLIGAATAADVPRLHELSVRTHQFNSAGRQVSQQDLAELVSSAGHRVITLRLSDRFGDDGTVGGCVVQTGPAPAWTAPLLMMSCRAMGRGVIDALLAWLCQAAAAAGAGLVRVPCRLSERNVPLRVALAAAGFRAEHTAAGDAGGETAAAASAVAASAVPVSAVFSRALTGSLPDLPEWAADRTLSVPGVTDGTAR